MIDPATPVRLRRSVPAVAAAAAAVADGVAAVAVAVAVEAACQEVLVPKVGALQVGALMAVELQLQVRLWLWPASSPVAPWDLHPHMQSLLIRSLPAADH